MITQINSAAEGWWNWMWPMFWQVSVLVVLRHALSGFPVEFRSVHPPCLLVQRGHPLVQRVRLGQGARRQRRPAIPWRVNCENAQGCVAGPAMGWPARALPGISCYRAVRQLSRRPAGSGVTRLPGRPRESVTSGAFAAYRGM